MKVRRYHRIGKITSKRLRDLRKQTGWSLRQLAEEVGISHSTLHRWEKGDDITVSQLFRMAVACGANPCKFFADVASEAIDAELEGRR